MDSKNYAIMLGPVLLVAWLAWMILVMPVMFYLVSVQLASVVMHGDIPAWTERWISRLTWGAA